MAIPLVLALMTGIIVGINIGSWGAYQDTRFEYFNWGKYFRSLKITVLVAPTLVVLLKWEVNTLGEMSLLIGLTYAVERTLTEGYKLFIRKEEKGQFTIPMRWHFFGKVVESEIMRKEAAVVYVLVCVSFVLVLQVLDSQNYIWIDPNSQAGRVGFITLGSLGGLATALGGAVKDAPIEGFDFKKFWRSPLIAFFVAGLLSRMTDSLAILNLASLGFAVFFVETYKKFYQGLNIFRFSYEQTPPGKFGGRNTILESDFSLERYSAPGEVVVRNAVLERFHRLLLFPFLILLVLLGAKVFLERENREMWYKEGFGWTLLAVGLVSGGIIFWFLIVGTIYTIPKAS